jgi:putative endonuclease
MAKPSYDKPWFVYIAQCRDGSLYTGIALDVSERIQEHNSTKKCRYTRFRKPLVLFYSEQCENYRLARCRESEIKSFSRQKKLELIHNKKDFSPE